jgi:hypothetical protein
MKDPKDVSVGKGQSKAFSAEAVDVAISNDASN